MPFLEFMNQCREILKEVGEPKDVFEPPRQIADLCTTFFDSENPAKKSSEVEKKVSKILENYDLIKSVKSIGPYLNFYIDEERALKLLDTAKPSKRGRVIIDFSSPNIAKPMNIGHLRSTIIGDSLRRIYEFNGWEVIADNHIGDWGTQFGKLIYAYKHWCNCDEFQKNPIGELTRIYIKFHKEAEKNPELEEKAREYFKRLENGDKELEKIWKLFVDKSLEEFKKTYEILGVKFTTFIGESFYAKMAKSIVDELIKSGIAKINDDKSVYVDLKTFNLPDLIIQKSDGSTLYQTRELAAIKYREKTYHPDKILYVVGSEQSLYFKQVFSVAKLMGFDSKKYKHVDFGLIVTESGKLSTRKGKIILLKDVIEKAIKMAMEILKDRDIENKEEIAKKIAIGAIKFNDLKQNRSKNITFDWDKIMNFEGDSGPYIQYTNVRIKSILRKASSSSDFKPETDTEKEIVKKLSKLRYISLKAMEENKPNYIASYLLDLCASFNKFYHETKVIGSEKESSYVFLLSKISKTLEIGMNLLGIDPLEKM